MPARTKNTALDLLSFLPFRLNRLAAEVSNHLAEIYRERFALEVPEWRVLATLASNGSCTAQFIVHSTRTHKTRISRAIAQLVEKNLIERASNSKDRRELKLRLTKAGRSLYGQLVPLALERERVLLACLSDAQLRSFVAAIDRLELFLHLKRASEKPAAK